MSNAAGSIQYRTALGAGVLAAALMVLSGFSGCTPSGEQQPEAVATVQQAQELACACVPAGACDPTPQDDPCSERPLLLQCPDLDCGPGQVACLVAAEGADCGLLAWEGSFRCRGGRCQWAECLEQDSCWVASNMSGGRPACVQGLGEANCGGQGFLCDHCAGQTECGVEYCDSDARVCVNEPANDGDSCVDLNNKEGSCLNGECCSGCVDAEGELCVRTPTWQACGSGGKECQLCEDNNPCTANLCSSDGECAHPPVDDDVGCSDGNVCNGTEACQNGDCIAGNPLICNDGDPCTDDSCDPASGCGHTPNTGNACEDGNACTLGDTCAAGLCVPNGEVNCDDSNPCTADSCNPATGGCDRELLSEGECDDGNACNEGDHCENGQCVPTSGLRCDDLNGPCQVGVCDVASQACVAQPREAGTPCLSGDMCVVNTSCDAAGTCTGGVALNCDDYNPCTEDSCDPALGCMNTPITGTPPGGEACSDDNPCTEGDTCDAGTCTGTSIECTPLDECHASGDCSPETGVCNDPRVPDGDPCTGGTCYGGVCYEEETGGAGGQGGAGPGGGPAAGAGGQGVAGGPAQAGSGQAGSGQAGSGEAGSGPAAAGASPGGAEGQAGAGAGGAAGSPGAAGTSAAGQAETGEAGSGKAGSDKPESGEAGSAGSPAPGSAGEPASAGSGANAEGGAAGGYDPENVFSRNPGGCDCRTAPSSRNAPLGASLLLSLGLALGLLRRRSGRRAL